ncbi:hypothetical protein [Myceligenerans salitolerans]|uniref:Uncharacterized protein n=1 Tax=Myceligenerans salitolerans TaxID=1230528 RepID=A0ABS3I8Q1_9MICO|nr:hypothetical protein [Myceligenerans salitolerans]MBO0609367.1 hypothetical protein [Myceligenerans salitolerans]
MSKSICIADASVLHEISRSIDSARHADMIHGLTSCVDQGILGFPRDVATELTVIARGEPIWSWANGLTSKIDNYNPSISWMRPFMGYVQEAGFEYGIDGIESGENAMATVGCLCLQLQSESREFVLATEDNGETPLRPTMEQIANLAGWSMIDARGALNHLGLGHLSMP